MTEILESLEKNILDANNEIANHDVGTPEYNAAVKTVTELSRIYTEMSVKNHERMRIDESDVDREREMAMKRDQQQWENRFKTFTTALNATGKVLMFLGTTGLVVIGFAYEKHDNICAKTLQKTFTDLIRLRL